MAEGDIAASFVYGGEKDGRKRQTGKLILKVVQQKKEVNTHFLIMHEGHDSPSLN